MRPAPPHGGRKGSRRGPRSRPTTLAAARAEAQEYLGHLQRLQAEFDNYRKRVLREQTSAVERAAEPVMRRLLEVLDDFELAILSSKGMAGEDQPDLERFEKGVELVYAKLVDALKAEGLERIDAEGQPFDPELHEALMQTGDGDGDPVVAEVFRPGYTLKGRVDPPGRGSRREGVTRRGRGDPPRVVRQGLLRGPRGAQERERGRRSRRRTGSSPSSTTRMRGRVTRRPRSGSRRSRPRTTSWVTRRSGSSTTASARWEPPGSAPPARVAGPVSGSGDAPAGSAYQQVDVGDLEDLFGGMFGGRGRAAGTVGGGLAGAPTWRPMFV